MIKKLSQNILDKFSINYVRSQVLKNAYGNDDTIIAQLDSRTLLIWYIFFGVCPWFINDIVLLLGLFLFVVVTTKYAKVAQLVLFLFCIGVLGQTGYLFITTLVFGGDMTSLMPLLKMTLKVCVSSLASITVFSGLDPDKLATGLLYFGCPDQLSFSISYAFRILPVMMEEFEHILLSYRLRGYYQKEKGILGAIKYLIYQIKIIVMSFYPLMLNTAKKSRTTVEALELKGYRYAQENKIIRKEKMKQLQFKKNDLVFACLSIGCYMCCIVVSLWMK